MSECCPGNGGKSDGIIEVALVERGQPIQSGGQRDELSECANDNGNGKTGLIDPKRLAQNALGVEEDDEEEEEVAHLEDANKTLPVEENGGEMATGGEDWRCPVIKAVLAAGELESDDEEYPAEEKADEPSDRAEGEVISESVVEELKSAAECRREETEDGVKAADLGKNVELSFSDEELGIK